MGVKIRTHPLRSLTAVLLIALTGSLSVSLDLFHNHGADLDPHPDCPAHRLAALLSTSLAPSVYLVCLPLIFLYSVDIRQIPLPAGAFRSARNIRGPPSASDIR